jgi:alpha-L-glutamate ligase-like protein
MRWLAGFDQLFRRGILGINRRNARCILEHNPRAVFPVVDDKLLMTGLCQRVGIPTPAVLGVIGRNAELRGLERALRFRDSLVIKPARGSGGRGILILAGRDGDAYRKANGRLIDFDGIRQHSADILSGMFSIGGQPDRVILQDRVRLHPAFDGISPHGIPDVRLVLYRFELAMAMLRLPTLQSNGRANLHQGGIGAGIDLHSGRTHCALYRDGYVQRHPDTGVTLVNRLVPRWGEIVEMARKAARAIGLGFVGIDVVIDEEQGPMLLEANARPGLAIQIVNNQGLLERIEEIDQDQAARR